MGILKYIYYMKLEYLLEGYVLSEDLEVILFIKLLGMC